MDKKYIKILSYVFILLSALFIILAFYPWYPSLINSVDKNTKIILNEKRTEDNTTVFQIQSTSTNRLIIPAIGVDMEIISSDNQDEALNKGAWHIIDSGTPDDPEGYNNMVIGGHRFKYTSGPDTFYNLDKLKENDLIYIHWLGKEYKYKVDKSYIVKPENVGIMGNTPFKKLTLFTCNPVYSMKERLVIDAYPVDE